jgi:single-strand DNA-binding protein
MSVNKVILIGNVGSEPEVKYIESNMAVARFSLATSDRGYTAKDGTVVPERTEWHNIVAWRQLAEFAEKWIHKGSAVYVEGKIRSRSYDDQAGVKRYITEIFADSIQFVGPKSANTPTSDTAPMERKAPEPAVAAPRVTPPTPQADPFGAPGASDDLPF